MCGNKSLDYFSAMNRTNQSWWLSTFQDMGVIDLTAKLCHAGWEPIESDGMCWSWSGYSPTPWFWMICGCKMRNTYGSLRFNALALGSLGSCHPVLQEHIQAIPATFFVWKICRFQMSRFSLQTSPIQLIDCVIIDLPSHPFPAWISKCKW